MQLPLKIFQSKSSLLAGFSLESGIEAAICQFLYMTSWGGLFDIIFFKCKLLTCKKNKKFVLFKK